VSDVSKKIPLWKSNKKVLQCQCVSGSHTVVERRFQVKIVLHHRVALARSSFPAPAQYV
jgi:hypothetical protein